MSAELGIVLLVLIGSVSFGVWQKSIFAALWMFGLFAAFIAPGS